MQHAKQRQVSSTTVAIQAVLLMTGLAAVCCSSCGGPAPSGEYIVKNGKARAEIIIAENPARMTKLAASNLQEYVCKMTGATLPVTSTPSEKIPVKIYVGESKYTDKLKLSTEGLAHGAFRMASGNPPQADSQAGWLALLGPDKDFTPMEPYTHHERNKDKHRAMKDWDAANPGEYYGFPYSRLGLNSYSPELGVWLLDDAGTLNAVCEFLRSLGVRWYFPGEIGEIVPKKKSIALPEVNKTVKPDFPMRRFGYWSDTTENILWNLRMGVNYGHEMMGLTQNCHGSKFIYMRDEVKKAHPDWYAFWSGKRATDHSYSGAPCLSSEGLFKQHLKFARMMFDVRKEPMLSLDACDGYGQMCLCELCKGKSAHERGWNGSMSDYVWGYVNRVAKELYKTHPDRKVSGLSYSAYSLPPEKIDKLSPNLALILCQGRGGFYDRDRREKILKLRKDWLKILPSKELYIYDYYISNCPRYSQEGIPIYFPHLIAEDLRSLKGISKGDMIEVYLHADPKKFTWHALAVMHLNIYVTARFWWDADQDLDAMLDEYFELFYGPAAREMKSFVEYCEANWPLMKTKAEPIDKALKLLAAARKAAGDSIYGKRVDLIVEYCKSLKERKEKTVVGRKDAPQAFAVERKSADLKIDGKLDEPFWKDVPVYELKKLVTGKPPVSKTTFQVVWADKSIIFGIRCEDADMKNLNAWAKQNNDPNIFTDDDIELLLETQTHAYYQIAINAAGAMIDLDRKDGRNTLWSSEAEVAAHKGADAWSVEIKIPTADMIEGGLDAAKKVEGTKPSATAPWYFNVCRSRVRGKDGSELSAFSPTGKPRFNVPSKFGALIVK